MKAVSLEKVIDHVLYVYIEDQGSFICSDNYCKVSDLKLRQLIYNVALELEKHGYTTNIDFNGALQSNTFYKTIDEYITLGIVEGIGISSNPGAYLVINRDIFGNFIKDLLDKDLLEAVSKIINKYQVNIRRQ